MDVTVNFGSHQSRLQPPALRRLAGTVAMNDPRPKAVRQRLESPTERVPQRNASVGEENHRI
jgi:hypothetical protein